MLSKRAKYGLHALLHLARKADDGPVLISTLAQDEAIPQKFLEAILLDLRKQGILISKRGKGGGYLLNGGAGEITLGRIVRLLDGPLAPVPCVSKMAYSRCQDCKDEATCEIRAVMQEVRDAIAGILDSYTLADAIKTHGKTRKKRRD
jgi:Rrf2 family protein